MVQETSSEKLEKAGYIVGVLAWLVPGAGHWYLGHRMRAAVMFATIFATFVLGVMLGGVEMVDLNFSKPWFCAQIMAGIPALVSAVAQNPNIQPGYGRGVDLGQVYAGVAGMLNMLCILDALLRAQDPPVRKKASIHAK